MIKLLCIDVDGTLLDSRKELPKENAEAVRYACQKGVAVAIASGRSVSGIEPYLSMLGTGRLGVCLNGGLILCGEIIHRTVMEEPQVMRVIDLAERYGSQIFLSAPGFNITNGNLSPKLQELIDNGSLRSDYRYCRDFRELRKAAHEHRDEILKIAIKEIDEANFAQMKQELLDLNLFHVAKSDTYFVDINIKGSSKGQGVAVLARHLNIPMEQVMCIGDNENDLEMVQMAGTGVAMGNAVGAVKQAASYVARDNDCCGVAEAIYKFI